MPRREAFAELGVVWFEEPVSSDDLEGLRLMRDRAPAGMDIAAGEYGYDCWYFRRMLDAGAVDVSAGRRLALRRRHRVSARGCAGGGAQPAALGALRSLAARCTSAARYPMLWPIEYFHDHARIEHMLFDGAVAPIDGALHPDLSRPGIGLDFKRQDARRFAV